MARLSIRPEQLGKELQHRLRKTPQVVMQGLRLGAERGRTHLVRKTPRDRGQMRNAWQVHSRKKGYELLNSAPYAGIVELGARPHKVSKEGFESIRGWVRRHFRVTTWSRAGRSGGQVATGRRMRKQKDPELDRITWGIVKKIEKYGQKPTYFVAKELEALNKRAKWEVDRKIRQWSAQYAARTRI